MDINNLDNINDSGFYSESDDDFSLAFYIEDEDSCLEGCNASSYATEMGMVFESSDSYY